VILVDSSVWIDHFRRRDADLSGLLRARVVMSHPFVVGELACGHLPKRDAVLATLSRLPCAPVVAHDDVLAFVERHALMGRGIGWVDAHLLASALVAGRVSLWSRDRRLAAAAVERGVAYPRAVH
jgi:predicted nucleic acid-binding protein